MKIEFRKVRLSKSNLERLDRINTIVDSYKAQGYVMTLRQLYYQLVTKNVIPNVSSEYAKLSTLLKEGRMAGIVDWDAIEDRLRTPYTPASFDSPEDILDACINQYQMPRQNGQDIYLEVWIEKDALSGVLKRVTKQYHVPIIVNRGYSSASAMYDAFKRFKNAFERNQEVKILYLGDFDPSGLDMIRDIHDRCIDFIRGYYNMDDENTALSMDDFSFEVVPIALTMDQIRQYDPPENPAKKTDPRSRDFIKTHGGSSWEVDALPPDVLDQLLHTWIRRYIDIDQFEHIIQEEKHGRKQLRALKLLIDDVDVSNDEEE